MSRCLNIGRSLEAEKGIEYAGIYCKYPCGSCQACRRNVQRKWVARIGLEWFASFAASWVTLTYDKENLPAGGELVKADLRDFLLTLGRRETWHRYFAVGEYGNQFGRPHYHLLAFNRVPRLTVKGDRIFDSGIESAWGRGGTYTEDFGASRKPLDRIAYLASYVAKKWTKETPDGRCPEFAFMSKRPAIGSAALEWLENACWELSYVPRCVRLSGRIFPLDHLMRRKLQERTGLIHAPPESSEPLTIEVQRAKARKGRKRKRAAAARSAF